MGSHIETITISLAECESMKQQITDLASLVISLSDQLKHLKNGRKSGTSSSGQFKILDGAKRFAVLRSIIDTAIKNKLNPLKALAAVANYAAE